MYLPAEWHAQDAVQLTWPHADTDWACLLDEAVACYLNMAREIALRQPLLIVTPEPARVSSLLEAHLPSEALSRITLHEMPTDDTWARDHGFITLLDEQGGQPLLLDFRFNGWGQKFASSRDNLICRRMYAQHIFKGQYRSALNFVLEGGSIESDGRGTILTTAPCLLAPNRNEPMTRDEIEAYLLTTLHARRILWLEHGYLAGDDTDSHVDTLARLCPGDTIAYVQCTDPTDEHYAELHAMEQELRAFLTTEGQPYRLIPLPMAPALYDEEGERMPSTYANFLIMNGAVLYPTYADAELDAAAARQLALAFPDREIVGIDCRVLVQQHGSLHCCTMQFPTGTR